MNPLKKFFVDKLGAMSKSELAGVTSPLSKMDTAKYINGRGSSSSGSMGQNPGAYVHRHRILKKRAVDFTKFQDREIIATYHPWQEANIKKVSEHVTMEYPIFAKPGVEKDEEPEIDEGILDEWKRLRLQDMWTKAMEKGRKHGWLLYYPITPEKLPSWYTGPPWHVYTMDEAKCTKFVLGHPFEWEINPSNREIEPFKCTILDCVFFDPSNSDDFDGVPEGLAISDDLIDYIFIKDAINSFDQRLGNGFMIIGVPAETDATQIEKIEENIRHVRTEMGLVVRMDVDQPVSVDWMNMAGAQVAFVEHLNKIEDALAMSIGFPKRWLIGDAEGAMESSGKDALQVNIKLKVIFKKWVPFIKLILRHHSLISEFADIEVNPAFELQLSEQEKVALEQVKTQTISLKAWLTDDEKRELDGYEPMTEEQKAEKQEENMFNIGFGDEKEEKPADKAKKEAEPSKPKKETSKADTYDLLAELFTKNEVSIRDLADLTGVSPTTISKIRSKLDAELQPIFKSDTISFKEDSVALGNDVYRIENVPVVLPQTKYYENLKRTCVRTPAAIAKVFNDPSNPREYRIGVTPGDDHSSRVRGEVTNDTAVGRVIFKNLDEEGSIRADIEYDLSRSDRILGSSNWMRERTAEGRNLNTSISLTSTDRPKGDKYIEDNLDIRSFVFTREPRNKKAGL